MSCVLQEFFSPEKCPNCHSPIVYSPLWLVNCCCATDSMQSKATANGGGAAQNTVESPDSDCKINGTSRVKLLEDEAAEPARQGKVNEIFTATVSIQSPPLQAPQPPPKANEKQRSSARLLPQKQRKQPRNIRELPSSAPQRARWSYKLCCHHSKKPQHGNG